MQQLIHEISGLIVALCFLWVMVAAAIALHDYNKFQKKRRALDYEKFIREIEGIGRKPDGTPCESSARIAATLRGKE